MKSHLRLHMVFVLLTLSPSIYANTTDICNEIKRPMDIVICARENHPDVQTAQLSLKKSGALEGVARQLPNPELEADYITGKSLGDVVTEAEARLSFVLELGGKRSARIQNAKSQINLEKLKLERAKSMVTLKTVIALFRLRQLEEEIAAIDEAERTFKKIQKQYKKRGKLNPESEVSLNVFQLAEGDYELRKIGRIDELKKVESYFKLAAGLSLVKVRKYLPKRVSNWPTINQEKLPKGVDLKLAQLQVEQSQSEVELAKSESWPDLTISPIYKNSAEGGVSYDSFGVGVSFPLPLFHANGGGRSFAYEGLTQSKRELKFKTESLSLMRERLLSNYNNSVNILKKSASYKELERKHQKLERLFQRGLVSSSMVIEAHRQIIEFLHNVHEQTITAIENLWTIYAIDGQILREEI